MKTLAEMVAEAARLATRQITEAPGYSGLDPRTLRVNVAVHTGKGLVARAVASVRVQEWAEVTES